MIHGGAQGVIAFPIYLRGKEGYWYKFISQKDCLSHIEKIDVLDNEYEAWDSEGKTLSLTAGAGAKSPIVLEVSDAGTGAESLIQIMLSDFKNKFQAPVSSQSTLDEVWTKINAGQEASETHNPLLLLCNILRRKA